MEKKRNSSIEMLRILAMVLIILHHISLHGFSLESGIPLVSSLWRDFIIIGGKIGVNIFILISGYFLINAADTLISMIKKVAKLFLQLLFYSVTVLIVFMIIKKDVITTEDVFIAITPFTSSLWWFASQYLILYLIHPFLNRFLLSISRETYIKYLLLTFSIFTVIPSFFSLSNMCENFVWFVFLYSVSAYISLYGTKKKHSSKFYMLIAVAVYFLNYCLFMLTIVLNSRFSIISGVANSFNSQNKLLIFIISAFLFLGFINKKETHNKFVNIVSSTTFGIYLIHDHYLLRNVIWNGIFKINIFEKSVWFIPYTIFVAVLVFTGCSVIDLIRIYAFEKPLFRITDKYWVKIESTINSVVNKLLYH